MRRLMLVITHSLIAFGVLSSIISVIGAIFSTDFGEVVGKCPWGFLAIFVLISVCFGLYKTRNKNEVLVSLSDKVKARIHFGDLFSKDGIIVIPVNDYFDTLVDDKVVSIETLHGKFVRQFFGGDEDNLKGQISRSLSKTPVAETNDLRGSGNKKRYPLGTVAEVSKDGKKFYLVALTNFNENNRAEVTNSQYQRVICDLFTYVNQHSQGKKVNIPLIGGGHSGVKMPNQKLLEFLLLSISMSDDLTLVNGIDVVLHTSIKSDINLSMTQLLFNTIKG